MSVAPLSYKNFDLGSSEFELLLKADVLPFDEFPPLGLTYPGTQLLTIDVSGTDREGALVCMSFA